MPAQNARAHLYEILTNNRISDVMANQLLDRLEVEAQDIVRADARPTPTEARLDAALRTINSELNKIEASCEHGGQFAQGMLHTVELLRPHLPTLTPADGAPTPTDTSRRDRLARHLWEQCAQDFSGQLLADDPRTVADAALGWFRLTGADGTADTTPTDADTLRAELATMTHVAQSNAKAHRIAIQHATEVEAERDGAYRERAILTAWLAVLYPAVIAPAPDIDEDGWQLLYLTPAGRQLSWHISPRDADLFTHVEHVPADDPRAQWDGHTTEEKYERIRALRFGEIRDVRDHPALVRVRDLCQQVRARKGPGGMINASQILGLLSPTWPDGNYEAPPPSSAPNEQYRFATTWSEYHAGRRAALDGPPTAADGMTADDWKRTAAVNGALYRSAEGTVTRVLALHAKWEPFCLHPQTADLMRELREALTETGPADDQLVTEDGKADGA